MKFCLAPSVLSLVCLLAACSEVAPPGDDALGAGTGGGDPGTTPVGAGGGDTSAGTGGGVGANPPLPNGPTTDALETVDPMFWVSYDGDSGALSWAIEDDGTGNTVIHATVTDDHEESASVSLSIPQAGLTDDMARSRGVRFNISGTGRVLFQAQSGGVIPESAGGWCDPEVGSCWNAHEQLITLTPEYQTIEILWDDLVQSWGTEDNSVVLYASDVLLLSWIVLAEEAGEFYLDAIELIPDDGTGTRSGLAARLSKAEYNAIVGASSSYTYENLIAAAESFPAFAGDADEAWGQREIAMFLGNAKWETGTFQFTTEQNPGTYCDAGRPYGCPAGTSAYFGRGAMQLSWNYNYKDAGDYLGIDLLNSPDQVATDPVLLWRSALWFWMRPGTPGTAHAVFKQGLGETIRVINPLECGGGRPDAVSGRISHYQNALEALGIDAAGTDGGC